MHSVWAWLTFNYHGLIVFWTYSTFLSGISCFLNLFCVLGFFCFFEGWAGLGFIDSSYQEMSVLRFHSFFFAKTTQMAKLAEDGAGRRQTDFFRHRGKSGKLDPLITAEVGWEAEWCLDAFPHLYWALSSAFSEDVFAGQLFWQAALMHSSSRSFPINISAPVNTLTFICLARIFTSVLDLAEIQYLVQ